MMARKKCHFEQNNIIRRTGKSVDCVCRHNEIQNKRKTADCVSASISNQKLILSHATLVEINKNLRRAMAMKWHMF